LLEPPDEGQLADPWGEILTRGGGQIFIALHDQEALGVKSRRTADVYMELEIPVPAA
jgi:hypothetical protein